MKILFFIGTVYPYGSAWSSRGRNLAKLFKLLGYEVHIISHSTNEAGYAIGQTIYFDGIPYESLFTKVTRLNRFYGSIVDIKAIKRYVKFNEIDVFITSNIPQIYKPLRAFLKRKNIPIIIEQCEWFDSLTFKMGNFDPYYRSLMKRIRNDYHKSDGIIAISTLLEEYYAIKGARVVRIPTILDTESIDYRNRIKAKNKQLKLVFAGSIGGKKELLRPIFEAIDNVRKNINIEFNIYGPDEKEVLSNINNDKELLSRISNDVRIHGRIPQQQIYDKLRDADFMVFFRPNRRSSNAGFPTKFAESLAVGTPVITNNTSDLGMYLSHGKNGFIVNELNVSSIVNVIEEISLLSHEDMDNLRINARRTAEEHFDYRNYKNEMKILLEPLLQSDSYDV
ncbi:MAG: glycosyltransferase family 4 protein [Clostridiales bacterium]|nr:glycosyltransferase family 4 protein [Clostridiales bacterium]